MSKRKIRQQTNAPVRSKFEANSSYEAGAFGAKDAKNIHKSSIKWKQMQSKKRLKSTEELDKHSTSSSCSDGSQYGSTSSSSSSPIVRRKVQSVIVRKKTEDPQKTRETMRDTRDEKPRQSSSAKKV
jgi:hypothetical protein